MKRTTPIARLALVAVLLAPVHAPAAEPLKLPPNEQFHLFLLIGQSNMAGRGKVEKQDQKPHARVLTLDKSGNWAPAVDPIHFDKRSAGTGLGRTFGIKIAESDPAIVVGLIPCAVGGSPIDSWRPGAFYAATKSHPWDDALRRTRPALKAGTLKAILWHQGESDATDQLAGAYEAKLHDLVSRLRKELGDPGLPFLAGQMGQFTEKPWEQAQRTVDMAHQDLPKKVARTALVSSAGLRHKGDAVHFDSESYREFGQRYAEAYLKLTGGAGKGSQRPDAEGAPRQARGAEPAVRTLQADGVPAVICSVYAPQVPSRRRAGLVVHLYGAGGSHKDFNVGRPPYERFRRLLADRGYWLVVPDLGGRHWMNEAACRQVDTVIAAMVKDEQVDSARVHLLGTSMGGGSSLIYVMRRPGKIASVAAVFPMTDFARWLAEKPSYRPVVESAHGIAPERRDARLREISALYHPEAFRKTPVFLLHGDRDAVVSPHHSRDFAAVLQEKGCRVTYREVAGAVHNDKIATAYQQELADFLTR